MCNPQPIRAIVFDRQSFEAWLAGQPPERAQDIREGLEIIDCQETDYAQKDEEKT